jgi:hypothetical protein
MVLKYHVNEIEATSAVNKGVIDGKGTGNDKDTLTKLFCNYIFAHFNFQIDNTRNFLPERRIFAR